MSAASDLLDLYRAITWRLWLEQRRSIVALPLLLSALFGSVLLVTQFSPGLLTATTLRALRAATQNDGTAAAPDALARAFIEHQAPYLLALFAGLSAASVTARLLGDEVDRGSLELLLATRHGVRTVGGAVLLAASTMSGLSWAILWGLSTVLVRAFDAVLGLHVSVPIDGLAASVAMQLCLALLSAELTMIVMLLCPALARLRTGFTGDPMMLIGALPPLVAFIVANVLPGASGYRLSLCALAVASVLWVLGAASIQAWFRPERFLET